MRGGLLILVLAVIAGAILLLLFDGDGSVAGLRDDQFARLVHYGAWGLVLGSALLFAIRGRFSEALRNAAIWAAAFLALIAAYAYSAEFTQLKDRVLAVLLPGHTVEMTGEAGREQVMVMRGADNHFRIDAEVNGETTSFLVDTGASLVALDGEAARKIGIDPDSLDYSIRVMTANGLARAAPVTLDSIRIGDIVRRDVQAAVTEGEGIGISLLGMSFLGTLTSSEFRGDRLILTD